MDKKSVSKVVYEILGSRSLCWRRQLFQSKGRSILLSSGFTFCVQTNTLLELGTGEFYLGGGGQERRAPRKARGGI